MRPLAFLAGAAALGLTLSCGGKEVFCHGPGCGGSACGPEGCPPVTGVIYRSVGPGSTAALAVGDENPLRIEGGVATFEAPLPARVGVGDALVTLGERSTVLFVSRRYSATALGLQTADGEVPADAAAPSTSWSLYRAYTSLADAASRDPNPGIPAALAGFDGAAAVKDLVVAEKVWAIACYADATDSADARDVVFRTAWNTSPAYHVRVFAPTSAAEVGVSQRHAGRYDPSRYELRKTADRSTTGGGVVFIGAASVRLEGLQLVDLAGDSADTLVQASAVEGGEARISGNLLLAGPNAASTAGIVVYGQEAFTLLAWNNVLAGFTRGFLDNTAAGTGVVSRLYNNTFDACGLGVDQNHGRTLAVNNLLGVLAEGRCIREGTPLDAASRRNVCSRAEEVGSAFAASGVSATYVDRAGWDFHLSPSDTAAGGRGADLSQDEALPFALDFEGDERAGAWDVGADQR